MRILSPQDRASETERSRRLRPDLRQSPPELEFKVVEIEKQDRNFFRLICGHSSNYEIQLRVVVWRPSKDKFWCEVCGKWVAMEPKPKAQRIPDEPMF